MNMIFDKVGTDIARAVKLLMTGEVVAIPTETVYGLATNALNEQAVKRIYEIKNRPAVNPLIIHLAEAGQVYQYATNIPDSARALMKHFWPGPLTFVLPKNKIVPGIVTAGKDTVAIRVPAHPMTQQLLKRTGLPLAAPSANPSGYISPTAAWHVERSLGKSLQYILDGGECKAGIESTIVGFDRDIPVVYRQGVVTAQDIYEVTGIVKNYEGQALLAPGMSVSHYSPRTPMIVADNIEEVASKLNGRRSGIITYGTYANHINPSDQLLLCYYGDWQLAARNLYSAMHIMDQKGYDIIIAKLFPNDGIGNALNDRLTRAAAR